MRASILTGIGLMSAFLFLTPKGYSQNPDMNLYEKKWQALQELESKGQTKTALDSLQKWLPTIQADSKNPAQQAQLVKAAFYLNKYQAALEEDGMVKAIYRFETETNNASGPLKALMMSILADMYDQYLLNNLYKYQSRTTVDNSFKQEDIRTWDIRRISERAYELHLGALKDESTKQVDLKNYASILYNFVPEQKVQNSLYDFIADRALNFFMSEKNYLTQPAYRFYVEQPQALGSLEEFLGYNFTAKDSSSSQFQALQVWQQYLRHLQGGKEQTALIYADLRRLNYTYGKSILPNKQELYLEQLKKMETKYGSQPASAEISYQIAMYYYQLGSQYQPSPTQQYRWEKKTAKELAEATIKKHPNSLGANNCKALLVTIAQKELSCSVEEVNPIQKPILGSLNYQNVNKLYFKVMPAPESVLKRMENKYGKELVQYLNALTVKDKWDLDLIDEKDYQNHSAEFKIPAQNSGTYILMVSANKDFGYNNEDKGYREGNNGLFYTVFTVSDISFISSSENYYNSDFYVTNRVTGKPLEGAKLEYYTQDYNSLIRLYEYKRVGEAKTDKNGFAKGLEANSTYRNYRVKINYGNDELYLGQSFYSYDYKPYNNSSNQTFMFLDRAIYRPGQTVYFKGIIVQRDANGKNPKILPNVSTTVTLYDANGQKVSSVDVTTNEYGSYQGSLNAPATGLTGQMSIGDSYTNNRQVFRVEEYKRPQFSVEFKPVDQAYKVGEKVTVKGEAVAYAGNKIDGGKVQYRVVRQARFPYWAWWRWGRNPYKQDKQEIIFGETKTDENGLFEISFEAIPDKSIPAKDKPQFTYTVFADVVDVTGETRSSQTNVTVGYVMMNVSMDLAANSEKADLDKISISATNLNGQPEPAKGSLLIEKLKSPAISYKERRWGKPDYFIIKEEDFKKDFPAYAYKNEDENTAWGVEKEVLKADFDTKTSKEVSLNGSNWDQGSYRATLKTADRNGEAIELVEYFTVYDKNASNVPNNEAFFVPNSSFVVEPDSSISVDFGSFDKNAYVLALVEFNGELLYSGWIQPNGRFKIPVKVEEKHRGGIHFHLYTCQNNRSYNQNGFITVPFTNKELKISYETFRDKLYPGQDEEWKIKISGLKSDKVSAEMVAAMYDASLDAFAANNWYLSLYGMNPAKIALNDNFGFGVEGISSLTDYWNDNAYPSGYSLASLNWFGFALYDYRYGAYLEGDYDNMGSRDDAAMEISDVQIQRSSIAKRAERNVNMKKDKASSKMAEDPSPTTTAATAPEEEEKEEQGGDGKDNGGFEEVKVRTNLNETVFFLPQLQTDEAGNIVIKFKMNEALTKWKFMTLAHTKDLMVGQSSRTLVTQKDLMVQPNAPRFFRQDDKMEFTAKISNLTKEKMSGKAVLQLFNASTMQPIDAIFANSSNSQDFTVEGDRSLGLSWKISIPTDYTGAVCYRVIAKTNNFSDGEESSLPVISNRMLITETQPLPIRGGQTKTFNFLRMSEVSKSPTMRHHQLTLEFTQNPAWYAVQSLPYLMEYPYECTEQVFSRFYANSLASSIANSTPRIKQVFDQWKNIDPNALKSNLHKNQELKYALLEETPWVMAAENEAQQKRNVGLLFDLNRMSNELAAARDKMADRQLNNGGFAWFKGGRDDWYITQYIVEGMGHLGVLNVKVAKEDPKIKNMMSKAVNYIDNRIEEYYEELKKSARKDKNFKLEDDHLDYMAIHYLYARSFYLEQAISNGSKEAVAYFEAQAKKYWNNKSMYMKGLIALALHRKKDTETPALIVRAARENALKSEEMGMYWKYPSGYYWYELPIETHTLMIEMFDEVAKDPATVDELKTWLLKAKQTTHWKTTKATASACYVLLRVGDNWLLEDKEISIKLGNTVLDQSKIQKEAGTGYFKTTFAAADIKPDMANITVSNPNKVVAWGAMYWQYFEQLDKITDFKETPLKLNKKLFKEVKTDLGPKLVPINEGDKLNVGDLVKVRVELFVDRDMEYVHMKDMRAAAFEPINVLSTYKYQGGLGYYESTRDAATNFFFSYLSKGSYVFEYPLRVQYKGNYSNGVTTIQCMYAPEFTAHSNGIRISVE